MQVIRIVAWSGVAAGLVGIVFVLARVGVGRWWGAGRGPRSRTLTALVAGLLLNLQFAIPMSYGLRYGAIGVSLLLSALVIFRRWAQVGSDVAA